MSNVAAHATRTISPRRATRSHTVTAVLVSHNGAKWLPRVLESLQAATRRPDCLVAVDTGSKDGARDLLVADPSFELVARAPSTTGFGAAVAAGLKLLADRHGARSATAPDSEAGDDDTDDVIDLRDAPQDGPTDTATESSDSDVSAPEAESHRDDDSEGDRVGAELDDQASDTVIDLRDGAAGSTKPALRAAPAGTPDDPVEWVWLLHDDCAVAPDALERLLAAADRRPEAGILGPKLRAWRRPDVLLECGVAVTGTGRRETGVVHGEVDQGQHDGRIDVLAVNSAGMLVRRDVWDRVKGFSEAFPLFGDDVDFCWRARRAGAAVATVPEAVLYHRQALTDRLREPEARRGGLRQIHRKAMVMSALVHAPGWRLPFTVGRVLIGAVLRFVFHLLTLSPRRAWDDLIGCLAALVSWGEVARARRSVREIAVVPLGELHDLRPTLAQRLIAWQESWSRHHRSRSPEEVRLTTRAARLLRLLAAVAAILGVVSLIATWPLWFGEGRLTGGALLPAPDGAADVFASFVSPWHEVGLGSAVTAPPYLLLVGGGALPLFGSAPAAVQLLMLLGPVLCGISAVMALRGLVPRSVLVVAALAYALLPATVTASATGRLGTMLAAILLPVTLRFLARLTGLATALPPATRRTVVATALLVAAVGSVVPMLGIALVAVSAIFALFSGHLPGVGRAVIVAVLAFALLWPWSGHVLANPGLLLVEIGAQPPALAAGPTPVWSLALLDPGGALAPPAGLAAALVVLAVLALMPSRTRPAAIGAWLLMAAGLALGIVQVVTTAAVPSVAEPVQPWPGPATLLLGAGAIAAITFAVAGLARGRRRAGRRVLLAATLIAPALVGGWWLAMSDSMLERRDPGVVSPYVTSESLSSQAPRTLLLTAADGQLSYQVASGAGPRMGDADVAPAADSMTQFSEAVAQLAAGGSPQTMQYLAEASVRFISVDTRADRALARQLDAVAGVRRVSTLEGTGLWEITGWQPRARAVTSDGAQGLPTDASGPAVSVAGPLPAGATEIRLGEAADPAWRASASGVELPATEGPWQGFTVPQGTSGDVAIGVDRAARWQQLLVPAAALALIGLAIAAPRLRRTRRRRYSRAEERRRRRAEESAGLQILDREVVG